ncbi:putative NF-X1-type domain-containing protein [Seiridium cardinale]|uniref:NF-X1-type domain-containing protein n=1 Tax=Seiridium cardinale TaxID=138064 RepID=A0ABR2XV95_9PEZI
MFSTSRALPSSGAPKHDNDHADIAKIRILPTTNEILSKGAPYLPLYDQSKWHVQGLPGLLDRNFRLLREDNLGPIRDIIKSHLQGSPDKGNGPRTNEYKLQSLRIAYDRINGFELHASVRQPPEVANRRTPAHREQWWVDSKNLDWERLVCLVGRGHAMFCVISRATCRTFAQLTEKKDKSKKKRLRKYDPKRTLFGAKDFAYFVLQPVDLDARDIDFMLSLGSSSGITVVEFPTLLLASFKPTLSTLQAMSRRPQIPMGECLVGSVGQRRDNSQVDEHVPPPPYASKNFRFNLSPLTRDGSNIFYSVRNEPDIKEFCAKSSLDEGQAKALFNALRRRLAICQGPPGTGKSYTGEAIIDVLLANKSKANLGPIICICQTNHALDQLLEHLYLHKGIRRIVRLGSQSKSTVIEELTLHKIMDSRPPQIHEQILNGKRNNARRKAAKKVIDALAKFELAEPHGRQELVREIYELNEQFKAHAKVVDDGWSEARVKILREFDVIGVTTSGLARFHDMLSQVMSKVVICEEAGEVLEAHTLCALMPYTQHLILIGDHQQLRPMTNKWDLQVANPDGRPYSWDISLFERLVKPLLQSDKRLPFDTLNIQRRMHPIISDLVRSISYPQLQDAENVRQYPSLAGFKRRLFWFHHTQLEDGSSIDRNKDFSFTNRFEVGVVKTVLGYLNRQNVYGDGEIAILTPYAGQLRQLKIQLGTTYNISMNDLDTAELEKRNMMVNLGGMAGRTRIRIATVDNFQGEEASVVIISLVRSNPARNCGFLNQENRINVLLSRAKHGMIIIGNAETYSPNDTWWEVIQKMQQDGNIGPSFELECPRHKEMTIMASTAQNFAAGRCTECQSSSIQTGYGAGRNKINGSPGSFGTVSKVLEKPIAKPGATPRGYIMPHQRTSKQPNIPLGSLQITSHQSLVSSTDEIRPNKPDNPGIDMNNSDSRTSLPTESGMAYPGESVGQGLDLRQTGIISRPLVEFISSTHRRLVTLELALLDEQESLNRAVPSRDIKLGNGDPEIRGPPFAMIQTVHQWVSGRYDSAVRLVQEINQYLREVKTRETQLKGTPHSDKGCPRHEEKEHSTSAGHLEFQGMLSAMVLLIRCDVVILADFFTLRRKVKLGHTAITIDLAGFTRLCEFIIETAQRTCYPRHEAEAHILAGKMIVITREASKSRELDRSPDTATAEAHLQRALTIVLEHRCLSYLIEDIEAVNSELSNSTFGSIVTSEEKRSTWKLYADEYQENGQWHVCANGHPFSIVGEEGSTIYCGECDAPVGEQLVDGGDDIDAGEESSEVPGDAESEADSENGQTAPAGRRSHESSSLMDL